MWVLLSTLEVWCIIGKGVLSLYSHMLPFPALTQKNNSSSSRKIIHTVSTVSCKWSVVCCKAFLNGRSQHPQNSRPMLTTPSIVVVEATGSPKILEDAINYVRRGGKLVVYGVYSAAARVSWPPSKIFGDEITILGSFSETYMFRTYSKLLSSYWRHSEHALTIRALAAAIDYLDSGKVRVEGIVNKTFKLDQWQECLDSMKNKSAIKAAIVFD